jgi:alpha-galactosidase
VATAQKEQIHPRVRRYALTAPVDVQDGTALRVNRVPSTSRRLLLAALALAFCGLASAVHAQDLNGYWDVSTPNPNGDGTSRHTFLHIEHNGETVSGEIVRKPNGITCTFKACSLHFVTVPPTPPPPPPGQPPRRPMPVLTYDGTLEGGKLMLTSQGRTGEIHSVGEKTTKEATEPPAALPLPALKDLPDNGLVRTPPMGWNSWKKFSGRVDDASVRGMADARCQRHARRRLQSTSALMTPGSSAGRRRKPIPKFRT